MKKPNRADVLYERADKAWSRGSMRTAFRLFLAGAKGGNASTFGTVAQFYDHGEGVKFSESAALYWYRRAYRCGDRIAANNIGCILRDQDKLDAALRWFHRAVKRGDGDANMNIAKIYLHRKRDEKRATRYLKAVCKAKNATDLSKEQAEQMLHDLKTRLYSLKPSPRSYKR